MIRRLVFVMASMLVFSGCPTPEPKGSGDDDDDDDDIVEPDATGLWTGRCDAVSDTASASIDYVGITLDLQDDAGVISGAFNYISYFTTSSTYAGNFLAEGSRTDTEVQLTLASSTSSSSSGSIGLLLTLSGDTMTGNMNIDASSWDCSFTR